MEDKHSTMEPPPPSPSSPSRSSTPVTNNVPAVTPIIGRKHPAEGGYFFQTTNLKRMKLDLSYVAAFNRIDDDIAISPYNHTPSIKEYYSVRGEGTYMKKEELRQLGGYWNLKLKSWDFYYCNIYRDDRIFGDDFQRLDKVLRFADTTTTIPYEYKAILEECYTQSYLNHLYKVDRLVVETTSTFYAIYKNYYVHEMDRVFEQIDLDEIINECGGTWNNELQRYEFIRNPSADQCIHLLLCYRLYITIVVPTTFQLPKGNNNDSQQKQLPSISEYKLQTYINKGIDIIVEEKVNKRYSDYNPPSSDRSQGKQVAFSVGGNTFHHIEKLREFGGRFHPKLKKWIFTDYDDKHRSELEESYPDLKIEYFHAKKDEYLQLGGYWNPKSKSYSDNNPPSSDRSQGEQVAFSVGGKTFHHEEKLREFGGRFNSNLKKWIFTDYDDKHRSELEESYPDLKIEYFHAKKLNEYKNCNEEKYDHDDDPMKEQGAWICTKCQNSNFASRKYCNSKTCDERSPYQIFREQQQEHR